MNDEIFDTLNKIILELEKFKKKDDLKKKLLGKFLEKLIKGEIDKIEIDDKIIMLNIFDKSQLIIIDKTKEDELNNKLFIPLYKEDELYENLHNWRSSWSK
jgi:hypothetical protein